MKSIVTECSKCGGTGICRDHRDPKGLGLVCGSCEGKGGRTIHYRPFNRRKKKAGIEQVARPSAALGAIGVGASSGPRISYQEFLDGKMPDHALTISDL